MAQRATRDTYAYETVGPDAEVRRVVHAGSLIPDEWRPDKKGDFEDADPAPSGTPQAYKHQLNETGQVLEEHLPEDESEEDDEPKARRRSAAKKE